MTDKFQWTEVRSQIHHCFLNDRAFACSWYIKNRGEKAAFAIVIFPIQNILDEGHYIVFIQIQVGSALTETENWDLLVDCTSWNGRKMLDAGVYISDKTHRPFQTQYKIFYPNPLLVKKQQILLFLKMLSNLSCLVSDRSSVLLFVICGKMLQIQRKICFKVNTFFYRSLKKTEKKKNKYCTWWNLL